MKRRAAQQKRRGEQNQQQCLLARRESAPCRVFPGTVPVQRTVPSGANPPLGPPGASGPGLQSPCSCVGPPQTRPGPARPRAGRAETTAGDAVHTSEELKPSSYLRPLLVILQVAHPVQAVQVDPAFPDHTHSVQDHRSLQIDLRDTRVRTSLMQDWPSKRFSRSLRMDLRASS